MWRVVLVAVIGRLPRGRDDGHEAEGSLGGVRVGAERARASLVAGPGEDVEAPGVGTQDDVFVVGVEALEPDPRAGDARQVGRLRHLSPHRRATHRLNR